MTSQPRGRKLNVLLSSAGRRVELLQCLRADLQELRVAGEIIAVDASPLTAAGQLADRLIRVPVISHPLFLTTITEIVSEQQIGLVVPTIDTELDLYAEAAPELRQKGCHVLVSGPATVSIANDKRATHDHLVGHGLPCPAQWTADVAASRADDLPYPLFVKPRRGSSSKGVRLVENASELRDAVREPGRVVETVAPGDEFTVDAWVNQSGDVLSVVPRRRIEVRAGEVSKGITARHPQVEAISRAVASTLPDAYGPLTIQVFADHDSVQVIEINARLGGGYPLSWCAGSRTLRWGILDALGSVSRPGTLPWEADLIMLRYDQSVFLPASSASS